ncbi:MAG: prephenate dehydrogenase [Oscillospiraceae bacterium]|nr:prephenate dehydrogenase [Oscillospiraceae bacterium]
MERFETIGIVGMGLIGGSLAMTIKNRTKSRVLVWDRDGQAVEKALAAGAADAAGESLEECGLLFLALYPQAAVDYLEKHIEQLRPGTVVTDLCGVKRYVSERLGGLCRRQGVHFISAHPMAGRETSGFDSALPTLYQGASVIFALDGGEDAAEVSALENFFRRLGFGRVVYSDPDTHDEMIAYTSQLAHILSSAYIQNELATRFSGFTGGSFQDLTRVSRLNCAMWGELFELNRDKLCDQLDLLIEKLIDYKKALRDGDRETLFTLMETGTAIKNQILDELKNPE